MRRAIFFDTETTGTRPNRDYIIELAAFDPVNNRSFERLINPGIPIPPEVVQIHQITDEMVASAPRFKEIAQEFVEFCGSDVAIVAHNLDAFDFPFLEAEFRRSKIALPKAWRYIDSLTWARRYRKDLPRHSLQYLRQFYNIAPNKAHRALNDVMILYEVFRLITDDLSCDQIISLLEKNQSTEKEQAKPQDAAMSLF